MKREVVGSCILVPQICLAASEETAGRKPDNLGVDGRIVRAFCGGEATGRSPKDGGKRGANRMLVAEGSGILIGVVMAGQSEPMTMTSQRDL